MKMLLRTISLLGLTLALAQPASAVIMSVTYVGTWDSVASGNPTGVGGPGLSVGQKYVIRISYDDGSTTTDNVDVLDAFFNPSGNTMRTIDLTDPGNALDIFVPMEGLDSVSPFIYTQDETNHFPAFISAPTLNFVDGSNISFPSNIIGLEFEGDFVSGAASNFIELFNTAPSGGSTNMVSQVLNLGVGPAANETNGLADAVDLVVDAGPNIVYDAATLTRTTSSIVVQSNDLGTARSDNENFIDTSWSQTGTATGTNLNDITVGIINSGLTNTTDTTTWTVTMTEQMTLESDSDSLGVSYANIGPSAQAGANIVFDASNLVVSTSGASVTDADLAVNALIGGFESLSVTADAGGNPLPGTTVNGSTVANPLGFNIDIVNSDLTMTTSTSAFNLAVQDMTGANVTDSAEISYMNALPTASASATTTATGTDFMLTVNDMDLLVNSSIAGFELLTVSALVDGSIDGTAFFASLIPGGGIQSSTNAMLEAAFGLGFHNVSFLVIDKAGASVSASAEFGVVVPEPSTFFLTVLALMGLLAYVRRRRA